MKEMNLGSGEQRKNELNTIRFPGWYRDTDGAVCCIIRETLVAISYNPANYEYAVYVNKLGERGLFDKNVLWKASTTVLRAKQDALEAVRNILAGKL